MYNHLVFSVWLIVFGAALQWGNIPLACGVIVFACGLFTFLLRHRDKKGELTGAVFPMAEAVFRLLQLSVQLILLQKWP